MDVLDVRYARLDESNSRALLPQDPKTMLKKRITKATAAGSSELKLVDCSGPWAGIHDTPPAIFDADVWLRAGESGRSLGGRRVSGKESSVR